MSYMKSVFMDISESLGVAPDKLIAAEAVHQGVVVFSYRGQA